MGGFSSQVEWLLSNSVDDLGLAFSDPLGHEESKDWGVFLECFLSHVAAVGQHLGCLAVLGFRGVQFLRFGYIFDRTIWF